MSNSVPNIMNLSPNEEEVTTDDKPTVPTTVKGPKTESRSSKTSSDKGVAKSSSKDKSKGSGGSSTPAGGGSTPPKKKTK